MAEEECTPLEEVGQHGTGAMLATQLAQTGRRSVSGRSPGPRPKGYRIRDSQLLSASSPNGLLIVCMARAESCWVRRTAKRALVGRDR